MGLQADPFPNREVSSVRFVVPFKVSTMIIEALEFLKEAISSRT